MKGGKEESREWTADSRVKLAQKVPRRDAMGDSRDRWTRVDFLVVWPTEMQCPGLFGGLSRAGEAQGRRARSRKGTSGSDDGVEYYNTIGIGSA